MKKNTIYYASTAIALLAIQMLYGSTVFGAREPLNTNVRIVTSSTIDVQNPVRTELNTSNTVRARVYRESFETVLDARDRYRQTNSAEDRNVFEVRARTYLKTSIEEYIHRLQATVTWIDSHPRGSTAILAGARLELTTKISELQNLYTTIGDMSYEHVRDVTLQVRSELLESRSILRSIIERLKQAQIDELSQKILQLVNTIEQKLDGYEARGYDMSQARTLIIDIRARLSAETSQESLTIAYSKARELLTHLTQVLQSR